MNSDKTSDEDLMKDVANGSQASFTKLVNRHIHPAIGYANKMTSGNHEAEEAVQEAFIKIWEHAPSWQPDRATFKTWFYRILTNKCIDILRKNKKIIIGVDENQIDNEHKHAEEQLEKKQQNQLIVSYIDKLPERQKSALMLSYYEGFSNKEAAEILDVGIKGFESLLVRARKTLRETMKDVRIEGDKR
ncbi:MAG: sigma-70 family RNA polymerase sigma factor [Alphaproteobacteria bacterium]|nr:sigma-70 family RNA polymerase sigma factor [Alphaproteobacteria bacterium]